MLVLLQMYYIRFRSRLLLSKFKLKGGMLVLSAGMLM
jgi:hypothetical protein